ncbi:zinc finger protein 282-like isoform X2 [Ambystoma mexicanum]|uniref:zinc finger protein 282-like isoform X2 n=1 Tax=Ambystoma mexicanum TaxID=8296 RepID=UPI0037E80E59
MEVSEGIPLRDSAETPVSFHDFAACFSKEEWKLLREWQSQLYDIVMNEIQQALTSLGPSIATSIFSLRPKEKKIMLPLDDKETAIKRGLSHYPSDTISNYDDVVPRKKTNSHFSLTPTQDINQKESHHCPNAGPALLAPVDSFSVDEESDACTFDNHQGSERCRVNSTFTETAVNTSVVPFKIKEEDVSYYSNYQNTERGESSNSLTEHDDIAQIVSFIIKEDGMSHTMDPPELTRSNSTNTPTGVLQLTLKPEEMPDSKQCIQLRHPRSMFIDEEPKLLLTDHLGDEIGNSRQAQNTGERNEKRIRKAGESAAGLDLKVKCKGLHGRSKVNAHKKTGKGTHSRLQLWAPFNRDLGKGGAPPYESSCMNPEHTERHTSNIQWSNNCSDIESNQCNENLVTSQPIFQISSRPYACSICEKYFKTRTELTRHQRTHSGERPHHCPVCGNSFGLRHHLIRHQRTHTGERPYQCIICKKRFSFKENLNRHQRTHLVA